MTLGPASSSEEIIAHLKGMHDEANIEGMGRFGINTGTALGISNAVLRSVARQIKRDHGRALALWASGIREARLLAAFTAEPKKMTTDIARAWASDFNSWEIVDGVSDLFCDAELQGDLLAEFAADEREFVRRTAFTMIAWSAVHMKKEPDATFIAWLPLIERHATDPRNFVKKAVNWALRQIGKRNSACHAPALALAEKLAASTDKAARWIGKDAVKELSGEKVLAKIGR
ncbi:DNA alkylation repair protein [Rhizobium sp. LjRoot254]|uniref:DNA alkylation repair protein n=1 Tax=Rhizobium sp. LjRoot254 TaxID=3342297 RepID=UPI003ECEDB23